MDQQLSDQLSLLTISGAISQQQLNAAAARSQVMAANTALLLGIQTTQMATLRQLTARSPLSAMTDLLMMQLVQQNSKLRVSAR